MGLPGGYRFPDNSMFVKPNNYPAYGRQYPLGMGKATEGKSYLDPNWYHYRDTMLNMRCTPIAYHFLRSETSIRDQFGNFMAALGANQRDRDTCGVCIDFETSGAGTNPSMAQMREFLGHIVRYLGRRTEHVPLYMPRWYWQGRTDRSAIGSPVILHNSDYRSNPNLAPFAGQPVRIIQFSSTAPGAGMPPGDMNIAIGMDARGLRQLIGFPTSGDDDVSYEDAARAVRDVLGIKGKMAIPHGMTSNDAIFSKLLSLVQAEFNDVGTILTLVNKAQTAAGATANTPAGKAVALGVLAALNTQGVSRDQAKALADSLSLAPSKVDNALDVVIDEAPEDVPEVYAEDDDGGPATANASVAEAE